MAPIDYSRFDGIDTSSSDDEDGDDTELEAGDAPSVVQLIDSFHQLVGHPDPDCPPWLGQDGVLSRLGLLTETQARQSGQAGFTRRAASMHRRQKACPHGVTAA